MDHEARLAWRNGRARAVLVAVLRVALVLGVLAAVMLAVTLAAAQTAPGRSAIARRIEAVISSQIRGRLHIGELTDVSPRSLRARDVRFCTEGGEDVLVVDTLEMGIGWSELLAGHFVSPWTKVHGGHIVVRDDAPGHRLGIDRTFAAAPPPPGTPPSPPPDATTVDLESIEGTDVQLVSHVHGAPDIRATHLRFVVHVWVHAGLVHLEAHRLAGHVSLATPAPIVLDVRGGTMSFDGASLTRANVAVVGMLDGERVHWDNRVRVTRGGETFVRSTLTLPDAGSMLRHLPLIAQGSIAELADGHFDFSVGTR